MSNISKIQKVSFANMSGLSSSPISGVKNFVRSGVTPEGPYVPPEGDNVNFSFPASYTPPSGDGVNFNF